MQANHVELGEIVACCKFGKGIVEHLDVGTGGLRERAGIGCLRRVEVRAPELSFECGGVNVERQPCPKPSSR